MAKHEQVKWVAPQSGLLIQAYREEALLFEKDGNIKKANTYRRMADRMQEQTEAAKKNQIKPQ